MPATDQVAKLESDMKLKQVELDKANAAMLEERLKADNIKVEMQKLSEQLRTAQTTVAQEQLEASKKAADLAAAEAAKALERSQNIAAESLNITYAGATPVDAPPLLTAGHLMFIHQMASQFLSPQAAHHIGESFGMLSPYLQAAGMTPYLSPMPGSSQQLPPCAAGQIWPSGTPLAVHMQQGQQPSGLPTPMAPPHQIHPHSQQFPLGLLPPGGVNVPPTQCTVDPYMGALVPVGYSTQPGMVVMGATGPAMESPSFFPAIGQSPAGMSMTPAAPLTPPGHVALGGPPLAPLQFGPTEVPVPADVNTEPARPTRVLNRHDTNESGASIQSRATSRETQQITVGRRLRAKSAETHRPVSMTRPLGVDQSGAAPG